MNSRNTPYAPITRVLLRQFKPQDARWLYFAVTCIVVFTAAGGGIATQWGFAALIKSVIGMIAFSLQFLGMYALTALMKLNHPVVSRLVPGYVPALRRTALAIWLGVCVITGVAGMLDGFSTGMLIFEVFAAGAFMLLISAPMRWPVQWCLLMVALVWVSRHSAELFGSGPLNALVMNKAALLTFTALVYAVMGWVVTRMIAARGTGYASAFARFVGLQPSEHVVSKSTVPKVNPFNPWVKAYSKVAHWAVLPWQCYTSYLLANPQRGSAHTVARAELGFGPSVHWVTQVSFSVSFASLVGLVWWLYPAFLLRADGLPSPLAIFYIALVSAMIAAASVFSIGATFLLTQGEQKLMLLLPGMPQGNALSQMLAVRHLRIAASTWVFATAWALVLPYPDSVAHYVAAFCWGTLPLVPWVVQDWASVRPPEAYRATFKLVVAMLLPVSAWAALRWLHVPVELIAAIAVVTCFAVLRMRWRKLATYPQALPAGRLAV